MCATARVSSFTSPSPWEISPSRSARPLKCIPVASCRYDRVCYCLFYVYWPISRVLPVFPFPQATPHAVRGSKMEGVSRETFAVFMEPNFDGPMQIPAGVDPHQAQSQSAAANLPPGVPPLSTRWEHREDGRPPQTFGEFSDKTHASYY